MKTFTYKNKLLKSVSSVVEKFIQLILCTAIFVSKTYDCKVNLNEYDSDSSWLCATVPLDNETHTSLDYGLEM